MPGPHTEVNTAPSWCSICVYLSLALIVSSLLASVSYKTQVLLHLVAQVELARVSLSVFLYWAPSEIERGLSVDVHWYQAKYMASVNK